MDTYCSDAMNSCPICTFSALLISLLINTWLISRSLRSAGHDPSDPACCSALRLFIEHLHRDRHESIQLIVRRLGQQRLRPHVMLGATVALQQSADEREQ